MLAPLTRPPRYALARLGLSTLLALGAVAVTLGACGDDSFTEVTDGELNVRVGDSGGVDYLTFPITTPGSNNDSQRVFITNSGKGDLTIESIITETDDNGFISAKTELQNTPFTLEPQASTSFVFRLSVPAPNESDAQLVCPPAPADASADLGTYCGSITINSDARSNNSSKIYMYVQQSNGDIEVEPNVIEFGEPRIGQQQTEDLVIRNASPNAPLTVRNIVKEGFTGDSAQFSVEGFPFPQTLPPGDAITYTVSYNPTTTDAVEGKLVVESDDPSAPKTNVTIRTGQGRAAQMEVTPDALVFPEAAVGSPQTQEVTVTNSGRGAALTISQLQVRPTDAAEVYSILWDDPNDATDDYIAWVPGVSSDVIPASNSKVYRIVYEPTAAGVSIGGTLRIRSNASNLPNGEFEVVLSGSASAPNASISPANMVFNVSPGSVETRSFSVTNAGFADLEISELELSGTLDGAEFVISPQPAGTTVAPGEIRAYQVTYSRQANDVGLDQGSLILKTNNPFGNGDLIVNVQNNNPDNAFSPVADIAQTPDGAVSAGTAITLDSSGSTSESSITYQLWTLLERPPASTATLAGESDVVVTLTPDVPGTYRVQLVVGNSNGLEGSAVREITVVE